MKHSFAMRTRHSGSPTVAELMSLTEAVAELVRDGDTRRAGGVHPPHPGRGRARDHPAAPARPDAGADDTGHRLRPDDRRRLRERAGLLLGRQPGRRFAAPVPRRREHGWPAPLRLEEHSHAGMANRYVAGASGLPFAVLRGYIGTDLPTHTANVATVTCPFTGEALTAVAALNPDVAVIHAQRADRHGNVQMWGITGVQKEAVLAARRSLVTVEEIVDPSSNHGPARSCSRPGQSRPWRLRRAARIRRTHWATTNATTRTTTPGTRSAVTARPSPGGSTSTCTAGCDRDRLVRGRDDDGRRRAGAGRPDHLLRRHRAAEHGGQPGPPPAQPGAVADLRVRHHRRQADHAATVHWGR